MAGVDRSLAAKARKQDASLQPTPKADQAPQHDSTEGVTFDGKLLSIEGMDDHAPDASPQGEAHHDDPDVNAATAVPVEPASIERSEEHTSELQSLMRISYAVFCLTNKNYHNDNTT